MSHAGLTLDSAGLPAFDDWTARRGVRGQAPDRPARATPPPMPLRARVPLPGYLLGHWYVGYEFGEAVDVGRRIDTGMVWSEVEPESGGGVGISAGVEMRRGG